VGDIASSLPPYIISDTLGVQSPGMRSTGARKGNSGRIRIHTIINSNNIVLFQSLFARAPDLVFMCPWRKNAILFQEHKIRSPNLLPRNKQLG